MLLQSLQPLYTLYTLKKRPPRQWLGAWLLLVGVMVGGLATPAWAAADESGGQNESYEVPTSPPLYQPAPGARQEKNYFTFGAQFLAGRAIPQLDKRTPGPAQLFGLKGGYAMGTPFMSELGMGFEFLMGTFYFSTGELKVSNALGLNLSYRQAMHGQFKLGTQLSFGQTYGRFKEVVEAQTLVSGPGMIQGNYGKVELGAYLNPLDNIELSSGGGYGYFTYSIQQVTVLEDSSSPAASTTQTSKDEGSVPELPSNQLQIHLPYVFLTASLQL